MAKKIQEPPYDAERFQQVKDRVTQIYADQSSVKEMYKSLADMYWIGETGAGTGLSNSSRTPRYNKSAYDKNDVRVTASTSSRDRVVGMHRMLRTSKPQFKAKCSNQAYADKIEVFLDRVWTASCERKREKIESDLILGGILFSDENLEPIEVQDLIWFIAQGLSKKPGDGLLKKRLSRLQELQKKTPVVFEVGSPMVTYPVWGEDGLSEYLTIRRLKGKKLKERWGVVGLTDNADYTLYDYHDLEIRCIYVEGQPAPIMLKPYDRPDMPRFSAVCDGTDLFPEDNRKHQPFLYGMWKSGLADREDEAWTTLMTSLMARGVAQVMVIDSSQPNYNANNITVKYAGLFPYIEVPGGATFMDNKALDPNFLNALNLLFSTGERTTVPTQTLGENIEPGTPYSGYAMASQNGRITIVGIKEGTEKVIHDACMYVLKLIKDGLIEDFELKPSDVLLDGLTLTVTMEVDLPQDAFRNAQVVAQLKSAGLPLTDEWFHNSLQIKNSSKMTSEWMSEQATKEAMKADMPNLIQQMLAMFNQQPPPTAPPEAGLASEQIPPGMHRMPDGTMMPDSEMQGEYPTTPGGPEAAMAGGEVMPATEPMQPGQARKGRA